MLHTFLKNSVLRGVDANLSEENPDKIYFNRMVDRIINRVELMWVSEEIKPEDKKLMLKLSQSLTLIKKQRVIALFQNRFLNQPEKFERDVLTELYLLSYEANMLSPEIQKKLPNRIVEELYNLGREDVSRTAWLLVATGADNLETFYRKIEDIVLGGLANKGYEVKDVAVIVWALGSTQVTEKMVSSHKLSQPKYQTFWSHVEEYLFVELNKQHEKAGEESVSNVSWVLWAYMNNQELSLKMVDLMSQILLETAPKQ